MNFMGKKSTTTVAIYGKTLREQFEAVIEENPETKNARNMLAYMTGYYGHPTAPCIDAGVFLVAFTKAIEDGLMTWEEV